MIKDIVVSLRPGEQGSPAEKYAISMAGTLEAQIAGVAFAYDPIELTSQLGYMAVAVAEEQWPDYKGEAAAALDRFSEAAGRAAISFERIVLPADFASIGDRFGRITRRFDLAVVAQAESERDAVEKMIVEGALFDSGRPVIVVPYTQTEPFKLDRLMICWDGSRPAVRAIADAMPLLARAGRTEVVIIADEANNEDELDGVDIGQHLARHGLDVEANRIIGGDIDVADALLSHAADSGVDLIVMGGYGHSRLREFILGGVTRSMLRSMTTPVLMSH
jgi:nucleotide-binding universal stress UspA family protein